MRVSEIPENETERIKDLENHQLIGLTGVEDYNFITSMASQICGTKISLITLVTEDKLLFLSRHGTDLCETKREHTFCAHAINQPDEPFIIENALKMSVFVTAL